MALEIEEGEGVEILGNVNAKTQEEAYKQIRQYLKDISNFKNFPDYITIWDE